MALSLPVYIDARVSITLTDGTSGVVAIAAVPTDKAVLLRDVLYANTTTPDGLLDLNFFGAADGSRWLGNIYAEDMESDGDMGSMGYGARPAFEGIWYQATGDGDSADEVIEVTLCLQLIES